MASTSCPMANTGLVSSHSKEITSAAVVTAAATHAMTKVLRRTETTVGRSSPMPATAAVANSSTILSSSTAGGTPVTEVSMPMSVMFKAIPLRVGAGGCRGPCGFCKGHPRWGGGGGAPRPGGPPRSPLLHVRVSDDKQLRVRLRVAEVAVRPGLPVEVDADLPRVLVTERGVDGQLAVRA